MEFSVCEPSSTFNLIPSILVQSYHGLLLPFRFIFALEMGIELSGLWSPSHSTSKTWTIGMLELLNAK